MCHESLRVAMLLSLDQHDGSNDGGHVPESCVLRFPKCLDWGCVGVVMWACVGKTVGACISCHRQ